MILSSIGTLSFECFILVYVLQASKLSLHAIEDKPAVELPVLTSAELEEITDPNVIINKMITLETQSAQMKPNLGAIAEYKKKVSISQVDFYLSSPKSQHLMILNMSRSITTLFPS